MRSGQARKGVRISFSRESQRGLRRGPAEAHFRNFALGRRADLEKLARLEIEHAGNNVGGELRDFRVEVAYHGVVIASRVLDAVFDLVQSILKLGKRFHRAQLWI